MAEHDLPDLYVDSVWRDSVFVTSWDLGAEDAPDGPRQLVDLAGRPVAEGVPGTVLASSDRYVVLSCGGVNVPCPNQTVPEGLAGRYAVHEITPPAAGRPTGAGGRARGQPKAPASVSVAMRSSG